MAYQARKSSKITERIELGDNITLDVEISPSRIASSIITGYNSIIRAKLELQKVGKIKKFGETPEQIEAIESVGAAFIDLFNLVFGEENTAIMVEYFENDYNDMIEQMLPFITDTVLPECKKFAEEKKKKAAEKYKYSGRKLN